MSSFCIEKIKKVGDKYIISGYSKSLKLLFYNKNSKTFNEFLRYYRHDISDLFLCGYSIVIKIDELSDILIIKQSGYENLEKYFYSKNLKKNFFKQVKYIINNLKILFLLNFKKPKTLIRSIIKVIKQSFFLNYSISINYYYLKNFFEIDKLSNTYLGLTVYDGLSDFENCIKSINEELNKNIKIFIVIDNPTKSKEIKKIIGKYFSKLDHLIIIYNKKNLGYIKSANKIFQIAKKDKKNLILLNSDTIIFKNSIENLINAVESSRAIVSPLASSNSIASFPSYLNHLDNDLINDNLINYIHSNDQRLMLQIPVSTGCCLGIHHTVINEVGIFDEIFSPGYGDEVDYSLRAQKKGINSYLYFGSYIYHVGTKSFTGLQKKKLLERSDKIIKKKYRLFQKEIEATFDSNYIEISKFNFLYNFLLTQEEQIFFLYHEKGIQGGSDLFIERKFKNKYVIVFNFEKNQNSDLVNIEIRFNKNKLTSSLSLAEFLENFFYNKEKTILFLNTIHISYYSNFFISFLENCLNHKIHVTYFWHNYFLLCPNVELYNFNKNEFCNSPDLKLKYCKDCWKVNKFSKKFNIKDLDYHRNRSTNIFKNFEHIFFSKTSYNFAIKHLKFTNYKIEPHDHYNALLIKNLNNDFISNNLIDVVKNVKEKILPFNKSILILGGINVQKGAKLLNKLCKLFLLKNTCVIFLGITNNKTINLKKNFFNLGQYSNFEEILFVKREFDIKYGLIPSLWSETYCYTADEILAAGLGLIYFDVNSAITERFKNYKNISIHSIPTNNIENILNIF